MGFFYVMSFIEKDLEEIIYTSGRDVLEERGLLIEGELRRQVKIGNYGIADLISITKPFYYIGRNGQHELQMGCITIYELKKEKIGISAFLQVLSYVKGIQSYLEKRQKQHLFYTSIVLVGKSIDTSGTFCYIPDIFELSSSNSFDYGTINFYTYNYQIDGLYFKSEKNYDIVKQGF
jgi:hypothetical protein